MSKAINTPARVSDATRMRVLDAVHELDYVPKETATSRARHGTGRIGVFAPFSAYPSFAERLNGVLSVAAESRTEIVVFDVQSAEESANILETLPTLRSLDGLVLMSVPFGKRVATAMRRGHLPAVLIDTSGHDLPAISIDDEGGGALAAEVLLGAGRRRLAFVGQRQVLETFDSPSRRRQAGFERRAKEMGCSINPDDVLLVGNDFEESRAAVQALLVSRQPDAIFAHTDKLAAAVLAAATRLGLTVPDRLSVVGFDDGPVAEVLELTTIRQPLRESGMWAARSLVQMIKDPKLVSPSLTLPVSLVRRRSA